MRADLPSGSVTFLFTDVEGSTNLLHALGPEAYAEALAEHRALIRTACTAEGGVEVDTQGDAFFFAFPTASGALAAAAAFTDALAPGPIRVRVGLHTGTPLITAEGYVGDDVHFAARVAATSHGGQVVLSAATAELVEAELSDLGSHRLKDIAEPVSIYQLGEGSFPPLKTIANTNLPTPASSFLGREAELFQADELLQRTRLLTIMGPGGQGKTRFALELATRAREERFSDYADGVFACFLSSLRDPALVLPTIAQTLAVREQAGHSALESLVLHLQGKKLLFLLDNAEHLLAAGPELSQLLEGCPQLTLLVTSRELLRVHGEEPYALPALPQDEGVALFCERSRLEPSPMIADICARLEGLPLAIELAAARTRILTPQQLLERLSQRLELLKGGRDADPRQQTLRATIEWSHDLLTPGEQELFARMAVFHGGCTLEAAEKVADADLDGLQSLVDKSLLRFSEDRFWMLETIREYAGERLEGRGETDILEQRHARFIEAMAQTTAATALASLDVRDIERFDAEHPNVRAAVSWALRRGEYELVMHLVWRLWTAWISRGHAREALRWADAALANTTGDLSEAREEALCAAGELARWSGEESRAIELKEEVLTQSREHGLHKPWLLCMTLADLSDIASSRGDLARAAAYAEASLEAAEGEPAALARACASLGEVALAEGDLDRAYALFESTAEAFDGVHDLNYAGTLEALAEVERRRDHLARSTELFNEAIRRYAVLGDQTGVAECLEGLAHVARASGYEARATRLAELADALRVAWGARPWRPDRAFDDQQAERPPHAVDVTLDEAVTYALIELPAEDVEPTASGK